MKEEAMIRLIKSLYWKWYYWRLFKNLQACLHGAADVRELQEIGKLMRECGEKHNLKDWREMGEQIEANAERIVLDGGIVFPD
jgi:hypothetical protein